MSVVELNKKNFKVESYEFNRLPTANKYCNLIIRKDIGYYERVASLLCELKKINDDIDTIIFISPTHGGFLPLECSKKFKNIYLYKCENKHQANIVENIKSLNSHYDNNLDINNIFIEKLTDIPNNNKNAIIMNEDQYTTSSADIINFLYENTCPFLTLGDAFTLELKNYSLYKLDNTTLNLYIPFKNKNLFAKEFNYFFLDNDVEKTNIILTKRAIIKIIINNLCFFIIC
jgi:hypothetical protein